MATKKTSNGRTTPRKPANTGALEVTSASQWRGGAGEGTPLRVPSGNVCLVRKASGLSMFLRDGKIPNPLIPLVEKSIQEGRAPTQAELDSVTDMDTQELIASISQMADKAALYLVIQPALFPVPRDNDGEEIPFGLRKEIDGLWIDEVDFEDKMFIFNYAVGGTTDVEQFRQGQGEYLESLSGS